MLFLDQNPANLPKVRAVVEETASDSGFDVVRVC